MNSGQNIIGYKGRMFSFPLKVDVYRNLQTDSISVKSREGRNSGKVILHIDSVVLEDAEFVVRERGWEKVHENGRKNVHAVVRGEMVSFDVINEVSSPDRVLYDPEDYRYFVTADGKDKIESAEKVRVSTECGIEAWRCTVDADVDVDADAYL